ncbi:MAG: glycosyltransferase family 4 protein [Bacteroidetes bacterium]|nr:glycosyltransferase family 4 protein [Bacteroidota bacterium]
MKKVAIVINTSWNIYNFRLSLIRALQEEGMQVFALAPKDSYSHRLTEAGCTYVPVAMQAQGANPLLEAGVLMALYKAYRRIKPDVILHYTIKPNLYGTLAAHLLGIPCINNVSGLGTAFLNNTMVSKIARRMYRTAFRYPKKVFFQNEDDQRLFLKFGLVLPELSEVIPGSGIDTTRFIPNGQPQNEEFTFLLISRLLYDKGLLEYAEAIRLLKKQGIKARFQLLGATDPGHRRGIPLATLQAWQNEQLIDYLGTTDKVYEVIRKADCVVLPSYREGTPRTLLEAASAGKPIVTTDVPGCNNVVTDGHNGFLCKARDAADLADKMLKMYQLPSEQRREMARNSRQTALSRFDERLVIDRYLQAIRETCA